MCLMRRKIDRYSFGLVGAKMDPRAKRFLKKNLVGCGTDSGMLDENGRQIVFMFTLSDKMSEFYIDALGSRQEAYGSTYYCYRPGRKPLLLLLSPDRENEGYFLTYIQKGDHEDEPTDLEYNETARMLVNLERSGFLKHGILHEPSPFEEFSEI